MFVGLLVAVTQTIMLPWQSRAVWLVEQKGGRVGYKQTWRSGLSDVLVTKAGIDLPILRTSSPVTSVHLRRTKITDDDLRLLKDFKRIEWLELQETQGTDGALCSSLIGLKHLTVLQLYNSAVTDRSMKAIGELKSLQHLSLKRNPVTDAGLAHLTDLDNLVHLSLGSTGISDAGLAHLEGLKKLEHIDLWRTGVTGSGLAHLSGLDQLVFLSLDSTAITDAGLEHLKGLKNLEVLDLRRTRVTDRGMEHLTGLKKLRVIRLGGTQVTIVGERTLHIALPTTARER